MEPLYDGILALFCAIGIGFLAWWCFAWLLRPHARTSAAVVIYGRGDGSDLEQAVRCFVWLRALGLISNGIVIADVDLSAQGRALALRLCLRFQDVAMWPAEHLCEYILQQ